MGFNSSNSSNRVIYEKKYLNTFKFRSNNPVEDAHAEARLTADGGYLFGIYDGHGGAACGQVGCTLSHYPPVSLFVRNLIGDGHGGLTCGQVLSLLV